MKILRTLTLVIIVLLIGGGAGYYFYTNAPKPVVTEKSVIVPQVPYIEVEIASQSIPVYTRGRVTAAKVHKVASSVSALVVNVSDSLVKGAFVNKGDILVELDESHIILDIAQQQATLDQVKLKLEEVEANARVAKRQTGKNASEYARFVPQLRYANSQVAAAQAALDYAYKQLEETKIRAPIDGKVIESYVHQGDLLQASAPVAVIYSMNQAEIRLPINDQQLDIIGFKDQLSSEQGPRFTPEVKLGSYQDDGEWTGYIVRKDGERGQNQLMYVVAQVNADSMINTSGKSLLPGSFVEAEIKGRVIDDLRILPREVLQPGNIIWLLDDDNRLHSQEVAVIYRGRDQVYIDTLLPKGTRVVSGGFHRLAEGTRVIPISQSSNKNN